MQKTFRGIRPDDWHGRMGLRNPERGFRTEMYFSTIPGEVAGMCSCHHKRNKLDGRPEKPVFQNIDIPGVPHLIRGNRLDGIEFSHAQWQDELDFLGYDGVTIMQSYCFLMRYSDGLSYGEIAAAAGLPIGTVMSRLFNGKRKLRNLLEAGGRHATDNG